VADNAHQNAITSFEQASISNEPFLFSGSLDCKIKAWKVQNNTLVMVVEKTLPA
jgi:hypothetical protein